MSQISKELILVFLRARREQVSELAKRHGVTYSQGLAAHLQQTKWSRWLARRHGVPERSMRARPSKYDVLLVVGRDPLPNERELIENMLRGDA